MLAYVGTDSVKEVRQLSRDGSLFLNKNLVTQLSNYKNSLKILKKCAQKQELFAYIDL